MGDQVGTALLSRLSVNVDREIIKICISICDVGNWSFLHHKNRVLMVESCITYTAKKKKKKKLDLDLDIR